MDDNMEDRDINPDDSLLKQIFAGNKPTNVSIMLQNWDKCVFKAEFSRNLNLHYQTCVVRLETEKEALRTFSTIAAMQEIAANIIPELVPRTFRVGKARNKQGRNFEFSVIEFVEGETLEDVWELMDAQQQNSIVAGLAMALDKLHSIQLQDDMVQEILCKALHEDCNEASKSLQQPGVFGGPHTGFLKNGSALLYQIMERYKLKRPFCTMEQDVDPQGIKIQSQFEEFGSIVVKDSDINKLPGEAIFCHNDLTPRNIILQTSTSSDGKHHYKLAGIIDWELAGFYPASYELSIQDTYLSGGNRHISFYLLLKEHMKELVPRSSSQVVLLKAMELIFMSQQRLLFEGSNIPAHIRKRFLEMSKLVRDEDPYVGWTNSSTNEPCVEISSASFQKLEDDVVEEMAARRKLKMR